MRSVVAEPLIPRNHDWPINRPINRPYGLPAGREQTKLTAHDTQQAQASAAAHQAREGEAKIGAATSVDQSF
jgi:hypothetical protein